jgi:hypothetical protein
MLDARWVRRSVVTAAWVACTSTVLGCASTRPEAVLPPQSVAIERPAGATADADGVAPLEPLPLVADGEELPEPSGGDQTGTARSAPRATADSTNDDSVVVISVADEAGREDTAALLRDLSRAERERRQGAPPPRLVLTDENVGAHAEGARLTFSGPAAGAVSSPSSVPVGVPNEEELEADSEEESYWRSRALEVRQRWRRAYDDVPRLEDEVERLRTAFYAEDDPVRRDRQVKPLWDRALDRLQDARTEVGRAQEELEVLLEEGRIAGALPGWLREGNELEPPMAPGAADGDSLEELDPDEPVGAAEPPRR